MYTTAMGRQIDLESLKSVNEETIAVGNMKVNARGDLLGPGGRIDQSRNSAIADHYHVSSETREEKILRQKLAGVNTSKSRSQSKTNNNFEDTANMQDNQNVSQPSSESEETQEPDPFVAPDKKLRGSLADSMAKEASVVQEKLPDPRRPKGPSRI